MILRIAEAGEVVGLPGTISGKQYEATAEALEPIQANFIPREAFLSFLRHHGEVTLPIAEILCGVYHATYLEVRNLGLSASGNESCAVPAEYGFAGAQERPMSFETNADARGNRGNHRSFTRNGDAGICKFQKEEADGRPGFDTDYQ